MSVPADASQPAAAAKRAAYRIGCLGNFALTSGATDADVAPRGRKARALVAHLALASAPVTREALAGLLWSERGDEQARASLRNTLLELRDLSGEDDGLLVVERERVGMVRARFDTDIEAIEAAAAQGGLEAVERGLAPWNGKLLADLDSIDPAFDDWLAAERVRRRDRIVASLSARIAQQLDDEAARAIAIKLIELEPENESLTQLAMRGAWAAGDSTSVRKHYQRLHELLAREFNAAPSAETRRLFDELVATPPPRAGAAESAAPKASISRAEGPSARKAALPRVRWPIAAGLGVAVVVLAIVAMVWSWKERKAPPQELFVAVLPFQNLSGDPKFAYFAEGVAAEIRAALVQHQRGMRIAGTATSLELKSGPRDVAAIHRAIGTTHIVDGSVRRDGARVRIIAQLNDARDGSLLWSGTYERNLDRGLDIQSDVARNVAAALNLAAPAVSSDSAHVPAQVLERYLNAMQILRDGVIAHAHVPEAVENLKSAVRDAPSFARGWAALAIAYVELGRRQEEADQAATMSLARAAAARAAALEPQLAAAHAALARVEGEWNWRAKYAHLQRALSLAPGDVDVLRQWSEFLYATGRLQEREQVEREILSLDPLSAFSQFKLMMRAIWVNDFAGAEQRLRARVAEDPRAVFYWIRLFWGHVDAGNVAEGRKALAEIEGHWPTIQSMNGWNQDVAAGQLDILRKWLAIAEHGYPKAEIKEGYEFAMGLVTGRLRGQGCVPLWLQGIFHPDTHPDLGWRTVEELFVNRGFAGSTTTCPHAANYHSMGDGQAVFPDRQTPTWPLFDRTAILFFHDKRSWRIYAAVGLPAFWQETGRWPDFCTDPKLSYDCKAEARKALQAE